jgi:hypothetical protein
MLITFPPPPPFLFCLHLKSYTNFL